VYVAENNGSAIGWGALIPKSQVCWLEDLWVEPGWIGKGVGSLLFRHAVERATELGARSLEWEAEPNAVGFYQKMGAEYLRERELTELGRALPVMGIALAPS
ncbi:MAG: GNAT family N-acetyltransferase, partial [Actinomycetota bacterium]|nr:GNAT family N-acetyltransferase [Actinomycetota bacterium]